MSTISGPSVRTDYRTQVGAGGGTTASSIVNTALADSGRIPDTVRDGQEVPNWQYLKEIMQTSTRGPVGADGKHHPPGSNYSDEQIRTHPRPIWKDGAGNTHHTDWCGMWATTAFQRAGVNCYWKAGEGIKGDVTKKFSPAASEIQPGDIITGKPPVWHHAVVTDVIKDASGKVTAFKTMNGNHPGIGPGTMKASDVTAMYRAKNAGDPAVAGPSAPAQVAQGPVATPAQPGAPQAPASPTDSMAQQLGLPDNLGQLAAARTDLSALRDQLERTTAALSAVQAQQLFGTGMPPFQYVPRPMNHLSAALLDAGRLPLMARGFTPFAGITRAQPFGTGLMGRALERAIRRDPFMRSQVERALGGVILPDGRNDGRLTVWRPPFAQVGAMLRNAMTAGALPAMGMVGAMAGLGIPVAGGLAAGGIMASVLGGMQRLEGNILSLMGNNVDGARVSMLADPEAYQHAEAAGIDLRGASFEDIIFLLLMKYTAKKEREIMGKIKQLNQGDSKGGVMGMLGGALSAVGPLAGFIPVWGQAAGAAATVAGGVMQNMSNGGGNSMDPFGDPSKMSETAKQQALQKLMGDLTKLYEMLSNMIKSMHDMQMTPVRNLRG